MFKKQRKAPTLKKNVFHITPRFSVKSTPRTRRSRNQVTYHQISCAWTRKWCGQSDSFPPPGSQTPVCFAGLACLPFLWCSRCTLEDKFLGAPLQRIDKCQHGMIWASRNWLLRHFSQVPGSLFDQLPMNLFFFLPTLTEHESFQARDRTQATAATQTAAGTMVDPETVAPQGNPPPGIFIWDSGYLTFQAFQTSVELDPMVCILVCPATNSYVES